MAGVIGLLVAAGLVALWLVGWTEAEKPERPWQPYATNIRTDRPEWFFMSYRSQEDCRQAMQHELTSTVNAAWYRAPWGCAYAGYQNRYTIYLVNWFVGTQDLHCVARHTNPEVQRRGFVYHLTLRGAPDSGEGYYCVLKFN